MSTNGYSGERLFLAFMTWVGDLASRGEACTEDIWIISKTPMSLILVVCWVFKPSAKFMHYGNQSQTEQKILSRIAELNPPHES